MEKPEIILEKLKKEENCITRLYAALSDHQKAIESLKKEYLASQDAEHENDIDTWLKSTFGIPSQKEALKNSIFIVFDQNANFVKTVSIGYGQEFEYTSPAEEEDTLEHWLRKNKLYAHRASSFCNRNEEWYKWSLKKQLENLGWKFSGGKLSETEW